MIGTTRHRVAWVLLTALTGVLLAAVAYTVSADVIWTLVPLLLTVAVVRRLLRHDANNP